MGEACWPPCFGFRNCSQVWGAPGRAQRAPQLVFFLPTARCLPGPAHRSTASCTPARAEWLYPPRTTTGTMSRLRTRRSLSPTEVRRALVGGQGAGQTPGDEKHLPDCKPGTPSLEQRGRGSGRLTPRGFPHWWHRWSGNPHPTSTHAEQVGGTGNGAGEESHSLGASSGPHPGLPASVAPGLTQSLWLFSGWFC